MIKLLSYKLCSILFLILFAGHSGENSHLSERRKTNLNLGYHEKEFARNYLERMLLEWEVLVLRLDDEQLNFRTDPDRWSIRQNLYHVIAAEKLIQHKLDESIAKGPSGIKSKTDDADIIGKIAIRTETSQKFNAPEPLKPLHVEENCVQLIEEYKMVREKTADYLDREDIDLREITSKNPLFEEIDLYQWVLFLSAHSERHLLQVKEIISSPHFPQ